MSEIQPEEKNLCLICSMCRSIEESCKEHGWGMTDRETCDDAVAAAYIAGMVDGQAASPETVGQTTCKKHMTGLARYTLMRVKAVMQDKLDKLKEALTTEGVSVSENTAEGGEMPPSKDIN